MEYAKPFLSYDQQADYLISRGMIVNDRKRLIELLQVVCYCRMSGFWHPFKESSEDGSWHFRPGTSLELIWAYYRFDRKLRFLFDDAIERIEVAIRAQVVNLYTERKSPFAYIDEVFPKWEKYKEKIKSTESRAGIVNGVCEGKCEHTFVKEFYKKYGDSHEHLPFWMFIDLVDFGFLTLFLKNADIGIKKQIAKCLNLQPNVLDSWLRSLNSLRNSCAHHSRIWNQAWGTRTSFPRMKSQRLWYYSYSHEHKKWMAPQGQRECPTSVSCNKTAHLLFICRYLLRKIAPKSQWHHRVDALFAEFADQHIDFKAMGFPTQDWQSHPLWK
jgi:abortive infection bacteriophage resistance protein